MLILENYEQSKPPQGGIFLPEKPIPEYLAKKIERIDEIYEDSIEAQKVLNGVIGTSEGLQRIGKLTTYFVEESLRSDGNVPSEVSEEVAHVEELMYRAAGYTGLCSALSQRGEQIARWVIECPDIISTLEHFGYTFSEVGGKARLTVVKQSGIQAVFNYFGKLPNKPALQFVQPADHYYLLHSLEEAVSNGSLKVPISLVKKARPKKRPRPDVKPVVKNRAIQVASAEEKTLLKNTITLRENLTNTTIVEAWNQQNQLFLSTFSELLKPDTSTIFQYGVGPDGQLLNLKDIKVQLARKWLGVMTLLFKIARIQLSNTGYLGWLKRTTKASMIMKSLLITTMRR